MEIIRIIVHTKCIYFKVYFMENMTIVEALPRLAIPYGIVIFIQNAKKDTFD